MFNINDTVLYGGEGACRITGMTERKFGGKTRNYYILKPLYNEDTTLYVPVDSGTLVARMRKIISVEEAYEVIDSMREHSDMWIDDARRRHTEFNAIISEGNVRKVSALISTLYEHKHERESSGKSLCLTDERCLKSAERFLNTEFAVVLGINPDKVGKFIRDRIHGIH